MPHPVAFARHTSSAFAYRSNPSQRGGADHCNYTPSLFLRTAPYAPTPRHPIFQHAAAHRSPQLPAASQQEQPQIKLPLDRVTGWAWQGQDAFSALGDRRDAPPLPLPQLNSAKRVVLVRHGQSTWNARNRIQGSSDFAVLTDQGLKQAAAAGRLVSPLLK